MGDPAHAGRDHKRGGAIWKGRLWESALCPQGLRPGFPGSLTPETSGQSLQSRSGQRPELDAQRDHYQDLLMRQKEFQEVPNLGLESMRPGGEGRRHLVPKEHMAVTGVSNVEAVGIESLKTGGEGRRHFTPQDHLMEQQREMEALAQRPASAGPVTPHVPENHVSRSHLTYQGIAGDEVVEAPIGGERRRHADVVDHMQGPALLKQSEAEAEKKRGLLPDARGKLRELAGQLPVYMEKGPITTAWQ